MAELEKTTFNIIVESMVNAETILNLSGDSKKIYVLDCIREFTGAEIYQRYLPLFSLLIDGVINLAHNKKILDNLVSNSGCFSFKKK